MLAVPSSPERPGAELVAPRARSGQITASDKETITVANMQFVEKETTGSNNSGQHSFASFSDASLFAPAIWPIGPGAP